MLEKIIYSNVVLIITLLTIGIINIMKGSIINYAIIALLISLAISAIVVIWRKDGL
jgi:hypothetical protein